MLGKALITAAAGNVAVADDGSWPDVSTASFIRFDNVNVGGDCRGLFFKPDGTKIYTCASTDQIRETTLSTAWDISTHGSIDDAFITDQTHNNNPSGLFFKDDGTEMYTIQITGDFVVQYSLSTGWDLTTVSYTRKFSTVSGSANEYNPRGVCFSSDGENMYVIGLGRDTITRFTLSTAWDISTASYDSEGSSMFASPINESAPLGVFMKPDGTRFYVVGNAYDKVYQWNPTTAYSVSDVGPTVDDSFSVTSQETSPWCVYISPDGDYMYVGGGAGNGIDQYSLG